MTKSERAQCKRDGEAGIREEGSRPVWEFKKESHAREYESRKSLEISGNLD
mgnify:CR=1 FL=1